MSYDDLKTLPDGSHCGSFKETVIRLGLLATDDEWEECLSEASSSFLPFQIRSLFITILVFGEPLKPYDLWAKFKHVMGEDILHASSGVNVSAMRIQDHLDNSLLLLLQNDLQELGTSLEKFGLPSTNKRCIIDNQPHIIQDEMFNELDQEEKTKKNLITLNLEQTLAYQMILKAIMDSNESKWIFFINAPGGYGKTFLLETLLSTV